MKPADSLKPIFTQCSREQVTVQRWYVGVPYRLAFRVTRRTVTYAKM